MRRTWGLLKAFHADEGGMEGLEKLLIIAAITLPLLGLLIVFRNELVTWVRGLWATTIQDAQATP